MDINETYHSVAPSVLPPQFVLVSYPHAIPKGVLSSVLETLTVHGGPPDDTPRWTNQLK